MSKILIIEDDPTIRDELATLLESNGYEAASPKTFDDLIPTLTNSYVDLILLDINLPHLNGEVVLKELRQTSNTPVIMVTGQDTESDELLSMSYGADDYITKPYNPNLLLLRIAAVLRRTNQPISPHQPLKFHHLLYYLEKGELEVPSTNQTTTQTTNQHSTQTTTQHSGQNHPTKTDTPPQKISLSKNEMLIFSYLLENQNRIVSRTELMTLLWDNSSFLNDSTLSVTISRLRDKLTKAGLKNPIETHKGQGYLLS